MKQLKIVALIASLFAFTSAQAGEVSVTGSMHASYQSNADSTTGNPLGMNTDLKFSGSTDTDFGAVTWTMATDGTFLGGATGNVNGNDHAMKLATAYGTVGITNTGDAANGIDDITPTAFEEANGSGSGAYAVDMGSGLEGSMSLTFGNADVFGTGISVAYNYYPKLDGTTNNEKGASADANANTASAQSYAVGIPLAGLGLPSMVDGAKISLGYHNSDNRGTDFQNHQGATVALTLPVGPVSLGYQKKGYSAAATSIDDNVFYKDDIIGIAYAVNDDLAISYNIIESTKHDLATTEVEQETKAVNVAYTIGGLTLGLQDAKTDNSGWVSTVTDDTRTISIKTAF
jgi:hypothetical protein